MVISSSVYCNYIFFTVEDVGGKCLPFIVDVRDENAVESAVNEAVKTFGGIDILVNNASAISLTGTEATPMKKYDLMNQINARGTYLWCVYSIKSRYFMLLNQLFFHTL